MAHIVNNLEVELLISQYAIQRKQLVTTISGDSQLVSLDITSPYMNILNGNFTGTVFKLPDTQTIGIGREFYMINNTDHTVTVVNFDDVVLYKIPKSGRICLHLESVIDVNDNAGTWLTAALSSSTFGGVAPILAYYGGQANAGRILLIVPSIDSEDAPYIAPTEGVITAVALGSGNASSYTCSVGIFEEADLVNPIATISLTAESEKILLNQEIPVNAQDRLSIRVVSGSMQKPYLTFYVSAT